MLPGPRPCPAPHPWQRTRWLGLQQASGPDQQPRHRTASCSMRRPSLPFPPPCLLPRVAHGRRHGRQGIQAPLSGGSNFGSTFFNQRVRSSGRHGRMPSACRRRCGRCGLGGLVVGGRERSCCAESALEVGDKVEESRIVGPVPPCSATRRAEPSRGDAPRKPPACLRIPPSRHQRVQPLVGARE